MRLGSGQDQTLTVWRDIVAWAMLWLRADRTGEGESRYSRELVVGSDVVRDTMLWASGLSVAILVAGLLGVHFVVRDRQGRRSHRMARSLTDLSEGFALVHALRMEIARLRDENQRLVEDRTDLLKVLSQVSEILEREARRCRAHRTDPSPTRQSGAA